MLPSQRFRFEQYIHLAEREGVEFTFASFYSKHSWNYLYRDNHHFQKIWGVAAGFARRLGILFSLSPYAFVYIHREAASIGPPVFEWLIAKVFRKKIIYDFDDAIWVSASSAANPLAARVKCSWKVGFISRWSHIITAGNHFLAEYGKQYCSDVRVIPTVVNTDIKHNRLKDQATGRLTIGWTGTFTNFVQLDMVIPIIRKLQLTYDFTFLIIANKDPLYPELRYTYKAWNVDTEIEDLLQTHIGVMPLANTVLELGKCAFKAIQYMSLGIPAVVSNVGANKEVVTNAVDGYLVCSDEEWYQRLEYLLNNPEARRDMGARARDKIVATYSVAATKKHFFDLFRQL
jgi:glycosyltransferase involved in cell wall biosynthesis